MKRIAAILFGLALLSPAMAKDMSPLTLYFDFFYGDIKIAEIKEIFTPQADGSYIISSHAKARGVARLLHGDVTRKSIGRIDKILGLQTRQYEEQRGRRAKKTLTFDEAQGKIVLQKGAETRAEDITDEILVDYLTAFYRPYVMQTLTAYNALTTDGWRLKLYEYYAGDMEAVETSLGEIAAIPMIRDSSRGERIVWFAPQWDYIPIKIYVDDKGHVFETIITGVGKKGNIP